MRNSLPESICGEARESGKSVFALMAEKAEKVPAGSNGITVLDWWNGNRTPYADYSLTGVMAGLKLTTRPEEIYRAILEATAFGGEYLSFMRTAKLKSARFMQAAELRRRTRF